MQGQAAAAGPQQRGQQEQGRGRREPEQRRGQRRRRLQQGRRGRELGPRELTPGQGPGPARNPRCGLPDAGAEVEVGVGTDYFRRGPKWLQASELELMLLYEWAVSVGMM